MKSSLNLLVAILLLVLLLLYMCAFTVSFNEAAIVTTFGSADENSVVNGGDVDGESDAGLHFKWPWPIQQVARKFDTRLQTFESPTEQYQTSDNQTIVVGSFVTWRVRDPLAFHNSLGTISRAENMLRQRIRDASSVFSTYNFSDLVNDDPSQLKLDQISASMRQRLQTGVDDQNYGIAIEEVGIQRLVLPAEVTAVVFERMRSERASSAATIRTAGQTTSESLLAAAEADRDTILSFAEAQRSKTIGIGEQEAAALLADLQVDEDFAIFLNQVEAMRTSLAGQTRVYIDASKVFPFNIIGPRLSRPENPELPEPAAESDAENAGEASTDASDVVDNVLLNRR